MSTNTASGSLSATGAGDVFTAAGTSAGLSRFNVTLSGTWVGSAALERSFDGTTWYPVTRSDFTAAVFTEACSLVIEEPEAGTRYRVNFTRTSGTLAYRFGQT